MKLFALAAMAAAVTLDRNATPATEDLEEIPDQNSTLELDATHDDLLAIRARGELDESRRCIVRKFCLMRWGSMFKWRLIPCKKSHIRYYKKKGAQVKGRI